MSESVPLMPRLKAGLIGVAVGLAIGGGGAVKVWLDGQSALEEAQSATQAAQDAATEAAAAAEQAMADKEAALGRAQARIKLAQARMALEDSNFGTANDALDGARALLKTHSGSEDAQRALMSVKAVPGEDPEPVLAKIRAAAKALDAQ